MVTHRGSAACNGCRSRKQKCDGKKPCSRCQGLGKTCTWPPFQKRGPAKGYLEALERRLEETETVLLRLCTVISEETLESALGQGHLRVRKLRRMPPLPPTQGTEAKKAAVIAYWERQPLQTAADVSSWMGSMLQGPSAPDSHSPEHSRPTAREAWSPSHSHRSATAANPADPAVVDPALADTFRPSSEIAADQERAVLHHQPEAAFRYSEPLNAPAESLSGADDTGGTSQAVIEFSRDFQSQFVW